jgi:urate oxidase
VSVQQHAWRRLGPHSFARAGEGVRTATVSCDRERCWVVCGVADLVLLNTTGSEFHGFARDRYTTLAEARDRILATAVTAAWRHEPAGDDALAGGNSTAGDDWTARHDQAKDAMVRAFAHTHSLSLQHTLHAMGQAVLRSRPEIVEVRLSLPNKHHIEVDLAPFGLDNPGQVFVATDRPYGLIEGHVLRDGAPPAGLAWSLHS